MEHRQHRGRCGTRLKGFATLVGGAIECIRGLDATARTNPDLVLHLSERTAMAVTMARMDVAEARWRLPSVPREMDKLPFPTDRIACGSNTLDENAVTSVQSDT